jgi:4-amino-4-deoxy-L-arabinose transferase-like glycosyltransferase
MTPLDDFDEAYYAEGAREMLQRHDLGVPYYNGQPFLLKPILVFWLIAGAFQLFGVTEFAARAESAFFATVIVLETYWFASRAFGARTGLLAGITLALCYMWVDTGREAMIDMPLIAALAPAMFLLFRGTQAPRERKWRLYLPAYPLLGIALLAKGPAGTLVSLAGFAGYLIWSRQLARTLREAYVLPGIALLLAVAAPWYVYESIKQPAFIQTFLVREHFGHLQGQLARNDAWWGHLKNLALGFFPWAVFLPAAAVHAWRAERERDLLKFCAWWAATVVFVFSLAGAKLPHYLAPAFPPAAILVAAWLEAWVRGRAHTQASHSAGLALLGVTGVLVAASAGVAALMPPMLRERIASQFGAWTPGLAPVVMLTALGAASLGAVAAAVARRRQAVFPVLAAGTLIALIAFAGWFKPRLSLIQSQPRKELAQFAGVALLPDEPLGVYKAKRNATIFYARRPIVDLGEWEPEKLAAFLSSPSPATALTDVESARLVQEKAPWVQTWTRRGGFVLVSNHSLALFEREPPRSTARPGGA